MAKSNDTAMQDILKGISNGTTRLPDFQRGWVWDDERIRGLIASITCSYPVGSVMFLEYGGDGIRFKSRTFTNVSDDGKSPEMLVLDQAPLMNVEIRRIPSKLHKNQSKCRFAYKSINIYQLQ